MTMKDRMVLHRTLELAARVQARTDYICKRRGAARSKDAAELAGEGTDALAVHDEVASAAKKKPAAKKAKKSAKKAAEPEAAPKCAQCGGLPKFSSSRHGNLAFCSDACLDQYANVPPAPVAKGVTGPLGALTLGQKFFVEGTVGDYILEKWTLSPGVFDAENQLRKVPVVRQITQKRTATRKEESLKPVTMPAWFEETKVTVSEDFALLSTPDATTIQSGQETEGDDMKTKGKKSAKKTNGAAKANGAAKRGGRGPQFTDDAEVKRLKGPNDEQIKRHVTILTVLKNGGDRLSVKELAKGLAKASNTKQDAGKVFRMHAKALTEGGYISITPAKA